MDLSWFEKEKEGNRKVGQSFLLFSVIPSILSHSFYSQSSPSFLFSVISFFLSHSLSPTPPVGDHLLPFLLLPRAGSLCSAPPCRRCTWPRSTLYPSTSPSASLPGAPSFQKFPSPSPNRVGRLHDPLLPRGSRPQSPPGHARQTTSLFLNWPL
jgi:hypothetical protein